MLTRALLPPAERQQYSRLRQILDRPGLIRGSLVTMGRTCGKESCRCAEAKSKRHRALYVAVNVDGKRRMIYVPAAWEGRIREWVDRYGQIRTALEKLSRRCIRRLQSREE